MPSYFLVFCFFRTRHLRKTSTAPFSLLLPYAVFHSILGDVHFTTQLSDELDKPVLKKGAEFVFKYQAVTTELEQGSCVFIVPPIFPEINLTDAHTILQTRGHTDSMTGMATVKVCRTDRMDTLYDQLIDQLDKKLSLIKRSMQNTDIKITW